MYFCARRKIHTKNSICYEKVFYAALNGHPLLYRTDASTKKSLHIGRLLLHFQRVCTTRHQFLNNYGYALEVNNSYSGSTICHTGYNKEDYSDRSFITRMDKLGNPELILIFGATNDSWANAPIGEYQFDSWTKADLYSFRPALAYLLNGLQCLYPNARVYYMLNSELKSSINESVYTICQHYDVPVVTLYNIDKQRSHPSIAGMTSISTQMQEFLEKEAGKEEIKALKNELKEIKSELREIKSLIRTIR